MVFKNLLILVLFFLAVCYPVTSQQQIAVLDSYLESGDLNRETLDLIRDSLTAVIVSSPEYIEIDRSIIDQVVRENYQLLEKNVSGSQLAEIGHRLGADLICLINVQNSTTNPVVMARFFNVKQQNIAQSAQVTVEEVSVGGVYSAMDELGAGLLNPNRAITAAVPASAGNSNALMVDNSQNNDSTLSNSSFPTTNNNPSTSVRDTVSPAVDVSALTDIGNQAQTAAGQTGTVEPLDISGEELQPIIFNGLTLYVAPESMGGTYSWYEAFDAIEEMNSYRAFGYDDWRMPSRQELDEMYKKKDLLNGVSTFDWYWSSTEFDPYTAWNVNLYNGAANRDNKSDYYKVRPVRGF